MRQANGFLKATLPALCILALSGSVSAQADDAREVCHAIAGVPDAGAPVSREAATALFSTLAKARPHCEAAAIGPEPDPDALFHLAVVMQREGAHDRALKVFNMAAEAGVAAAKTKLGDYHNFGIGGVRENHALAIAYYDAAVEGGDVPAKATLAIMYQLGRGVPQDFERMVALLQESADAGYHFSLVRLAELYMNPQSVPASLAKEFDLPDPIKAAEYYEKAAEQGSTKARVELEKFYEGEGLFDAPEVKVKWIRHAAERGDAQAINSLGFLYETGDGVDYDPMKAAEFYIKALETGDLPVRSLRRQANGNVPPWDGETALNFQTILRDRGLYRGALDAKIGPGTLSAARRVAEGQ